MTTQTTNDKPIARYKVGDKFKENDSVIIRTILEARYSAKGKLKESDLIEHHEHLNTAQKIANAQAKLDAAEEDYNWPL